MEIAAADNAFSNNPEAKVINAINGEVKVGDWVIAEPSDEYGCLVGVVTAIDKLGSPEHDTENETDDIHVDFTAIEYSEARKADFLEAFDHTNPDAGSFDELPLDDVIMAPEMLIRITELGHEEIDRLANDYQYAELEKTKRGLENRLKKLLDSKRRDDVVTFEQLGVDRLYVDEAHGFKNLFLYTKMRNVAGLSTSEAQKSSDLFMKCRYMDELTDNKGVIFATGTPMYTLQQSRKADKYVKKAKADT